MGFQSMVENLSEGKPIEEARITTKDLRRLVVEVEEVIRRVESLQNPGVGIAWSQEQQRVLQHLQQAIRQIDRAAASPLFR